MFQLKNILIPTIVIIVFAMTLNKQAQAQTIIDTGAATGINATVNTNSDVNSVNIRNRIKAEMDAKIQNIKTNQEIRNQIIEKSKLPSTTPPKMEKKVEKKIENRIEQKVEDRIEQRMENRLSSTSPQFRKEGYENNGKEMMAKLLKEKKDAVHKQLNVAMQNLIELRKRISSRIEKDRLNGKNLAGVSELLKLADAKIALAKEAIAKLRYYEPVPKNTTDTGTTTVAVNLDPVRELIDTAQKSIKEAHRALNDVVVAIAKISGNNKGQIGSSTPAINTVLPTPSPTTTTPSTINQ